MPKLFLRCLKSFLYGFTFTLIIVVATAVLTLDWFGGCGETFQTADGALIKGECIGRDAFKTYIKGVFK